MKHFCRLAFVVAPILALASCATASHRLIGALRPAGSPSDVSVLLAAPEKFEEVAELKASSGASLQSAEVKWDRAVGELRKEAARVGANAIVLEIPEDDGAGAASVSFGKQATASVGRPIELGLGTSTNSALLAQSLRALAIYVPN